MTANASDCYLVTSKKYGPAIQLCWVVFFSCMIQALISSCSLKSSIENLHLDEEVIVRAQSVQIRSLFGLKSAKSESYFRSSLPAIKYSKKDQRLVWFESKNGSSLRLFTVTPIWYDKASLDELLDSFLRVTPSYLGIGFELEIILVSENNSFYDSQKKGFKEIVPVSWLIPVPEGETDFSNVVANVFPKALHELFHVSQKLAVPDKRLVTRSAVGEEALASLFEICAFQLITGEKLLLNTSMMSESFLKPAISIEDQSEKLQILRQYLENADFGSRKIFESAAGSALAYLYLTSSTKAQNERRTNNLDQVCRNIFQFRRTPALIRDF